MNLVSEEIDQKLWVILPGCCEQKHYLGYNPHTFHGRISVWCPKLSRWTNISKTQIQECSEFSKYWIIGYLSGNEPDAPRTESGDYFPNDSSEMVLWRKSIVRFSETGYWNSTKRYCEQCGYQQLYASVDEDCEHCAQDRN